AEQLVAGIAIQYYGEVLLRCAGDIIARNNRIVHHWFAIIVEDPLEIIFEVRKRQRDLLMVCAEMFGNLARERRLVVSTFKRHGKGLQPGGFFSGQRRDESAIDAPTEKGAYLQVGRYQAAVHRYSQKLVDAFAGHSFAQRLSVFESGGNIPPASHHS